MAPELIKPLEVPLADEVEDVLCALELALDDVDPLLAVEGPVLDDDAEEDAPPADELELDEALLNPPDEPADDDPRPDEDDELEPRVDAALELVSDATVTTSHTPSTHWVPALQPVSSRHTVRHTPPRHAYPSTQSRLSAQRRLSTEVPTRGHPTKPSASRRAPRTLEGDTVDRLPGAAIPSKRRGPTRSSSGRSAHATRRHHHIARLASAWERAPRWSEQKRHFMPQSEGCGPRSDS
ncbi:MAG: hypothetical protein AB2A00_39160 [Myxococcota bacterium]